MQLGATFLPLLLSRNAKIPRSGSPSGSAPKFSGLLLVITSHAPVQNVSFDFVDNFWSYPGGRQTHIRHRQNITTECAIKSIKLKEKSAQTDANTARALAVVRFGHRPHARPPARCKHANTQTGPITIHCAAAPQLASAQCN